ncbi:tRNA (guanine(10)-N(2))-dimethyltransferase, partial [Candidatus Bathyarchaeota archaeon]
KSGGLLALTATDMAPLCGVHVRACVRKYGAVPIRTGYSKELAVRIMLGAFVRVASAHEVGVRPLLSHATDHYARAYCLLVRGQGKANESSSKLGYIAHCPSCLDREVIRGLAEPIEARCPSCGSRRLICGPLWVGELFDTEFCREVLAELRDTPWVGRRARKVLELVVEEAGGPPTYFSLPVLCDVLDVSVPPVREVVKELRERGWRATRTHFDTQAVRTDAPASEVAEVVKELNLI